MIPTKVTVKRALTATCVAFATLPWVAASSDAARDAKTTQSTAAPPSGSTARPAIEAAKRGVHASDASGDIRASALIGSEVRDRDGAKLGEIRDVVIDTRGGRIDYTIVGFGGMLGIGEKLFAYPLASFKRVASHSPFVLDIDRERLAAAPGFDPVRWPSFASDDYYDRVDRFHGKGGGTATRHLVRGSRVLDANVRERNGGDVGDVEDFVVDLSDGSIRYFAVRFDRSFRPDGRLVAMPVSALAVEDTERGDVFYVATPKEVAQAPSFAAGRWADTADADFRAAIDRYQQTWINNPAARSWPQHRAAPQTEPRAEASQRGAAR